MSKIKASRGDRIFNAVVHVIIALIVLTVIVLLAIFADVGVAVLAILNSFRALRVRQD